MKFKKILGSFLSAMTMFSVSPVMAYDVTDETSLDEYMTKTDNDKQDGVIKSDVTTTTSHTSTNEDVRFVADGNRVLSGEILSFTNSNGSLTLSINNGNTFTINNELYLEGTKLKNGRSGNYNFSDITGTGSLIFANTSAFTANSVTAKELSLTNGSTFTINQTGEINSITVSGSNIKSSTLTANKISSNIVNVSNFSVAQVAELYVTTSLSASNQSVIDARNMVGGVNTGKIKAGSINLTNSSANADTITADNVKLVSVSSIDLVGDDASGYSKSGTLTVNDTLDIGAGSTVKANNISASTITGNGEIIIGSAGAEASVINTDQMGINKGQFTNTIIKGKSGEYGTITFVSGGDNITFEGDLNQLQIKGGSKSANANVTVKDDSKLAIVAGTDTTGNSVVFDETTFSIGENSEFKLNAKESNIEFKSSSAKTKNNIELSEGSTINVSSLGSNKVVFDNINHTNNNNVGTLNIKENSIAEITAGSKPSNEWMTGQVFVDEYNQKNGSYVTMNANSTLNANTITLDQNSTLKLVNVANGTSYGVEKDGVLANSAFSADSARIQSSGKSKLYSKGTFDIKSSIINVDDGTLSIGATGKDNGTGKIVGINIDKDSTINLDGELRIFGEDNATHNIEAKFTSGNSGVLRKVGKSKLVLGGSDSLIEIKTVKLGIDKDVTSTTSSSAETVVGSGNVTIKSDISSNNFLVAGKTSVQLERGVTIGNGKDGSEIRFQNNSVYDPNQKDSLSVLEMENNSALTADKIELSVDFADLKGGVIGGKEEDNTMTTSEIIFGDKARINLYDGDVKIHVANATTGGFKSQGSKINITGKGSLVFDDAIGSQAHWTINNGSTQSFKEGSWFDGVRMKDGVNHGGVFYNSGTVIIDNNTTIGFSDKNPMGKHEENFAKEQGGAVYNTNFFGMYPGRTSTGVTFENNRSTSSATKDYGSYQSTAIYEYYGEGGAIYNEGSTIKDAIISLGHKTTFRDNAANVAGGAIYNYAYDGQNAYNGYKAVSIGDSSLFELNQAGYQGGAIFTKVGDAENLDGTVLLGKKAAFVNNVVGLDVQKPTFSQNLVYFYKSEGGAAYVNKGATLEIGAHSGFYNNFASYSGSALSNKGTIIFNDDGQIGNEPLENGKIVAGAVTFVGGGRVDETKEDITSGSTVKTGNIFYTHQGGAIYNNSGKFGTRMSDGTIKDGLYNASFDGNRALFGGAIYNYSDATNPQTLVIDNSTFTGNSANRGVAIFDDPNASGKNTEEVNSSGGAIYNAGRNTSYKLKFDDVKGYYPAETIVNVNGGSKLAVSSSTFENNSAANRAGAIYNDILSEIELSSSKFNQNQASQGGAIYNTGKETVNGTEYIGATILTKIGEKGEKIVFNENTATRQFRENNPNNDQTSLSDEYLGGALYNAGTIKHKDSTSVYDNEIIGMDFTGNSAGAGVGKDPAKDTIGRGGAFYNASSGTTYVGNSKFENNFTYAYNKEQDTTINSYKAEGGAIYNEKGELIIGDGAKFINNGRDKRNIEEIKTGKGGAIFNADGAKTVIDSKTAEFYGNAATAKGGAIYNAANGELVVKNGSSIGVADEVANKAEYGGGIFNAGKLTMEEGTSLVNNTASSGGGMYIEKGSSVNADADGVNHLSKVTFDSNTANHGAGLYVDEGIDIVLDNVTFKGNSTTGLGSAFYNEGKLTLGENNTFFNNSGSLIGNSGELIFTKGFELDGTKKGNEGNTSFITNEGDGIVKITTENGKSLVITGVGDGSANGAALSLLDDSSITTDSEANTLKNATFTKNKGKNGGAVYKESTVDLKIDKTTFDGNTATQKGGAIYNGKGKLTIGADTVFTNNGAVNGGAIYNANGATTSFAQGFKGFSGANSKNYATGNGGAISNDGIMNIYYDEANNTESITFSNQGKDINTGNGGALHLGAKAIIKTNDVSKTSSGYDVGYLKNGVFENNSASKGGALFNESNLVIEDTKFSGNKSGTAGGAIYNKGNVIDGRDYGILDIIVDGNNTIYDNKSDGIGGAIYNENGTVNIVAKTGKVTTISGNTATNKGGIVASDGGVINVGGNIKFSNNSTISSGSTGGVFNIANGTLNLDTTDGDIIFENNAAAKGSAIYLENGSTINFKGTDEHEITFSKTQTVASDSSSNKMNVLGGNINFESSLGDFTGQFTQTGGTVTVANNFMNLKGTHNEVTGGTFILTEGAKLAATSDTEGNLLNINGATIRFENNSVSKITDLSDVLYQYKDSSKNPFSTAGNKLTYSSGSGDSKVDAKIGLSDAKLDLALKQNFVDVVDEATGEKFKKNSGEYTLVLNGGADKNIDIAKDGKHAVSDLVVGDAVQIATDIKISNGGKVSLEGAGLSKDVSKIELSNGGQLNIFNDSYEKTVDGVLSKYNTDLTFCGELIGDATSKVYKGYKTSPLEDGLAGRAKLTFAKGSSAENYMGSYIQNAGTLEFEDGSIYFNHANSQVSYIEDAKLILNDGVIYTGNTTINFDGKGGKFVLGSATDINMTNPNEKIKFDAKDKNNNTVHNEVILGKDTTIQVTHGETDVDASDEIISIGKNNAFSGIIIGGEEDKNDQINIKVSTEGIEGKDTTFNVEENGKLGFGDVNFVDSAGNDVTGTYSPKVILDKNSEFYLVSGRNNDFSNLNLSTKATEWSKESGSLIKENASKTTLTGAKTDLSGFHGTITIKNGQIALGEDIAEDKKFADDTRFDLSKLASGATVIVENITQGEDMTLINGIGNEIIGTPTGDENYKLSIKNNKGSIIFTKDGSTAYTPDIDVKNGSLLQMEAKGNIEVGDVNVISKFSEISGDKQESAAGLKSEGKITTGEINVIGATKSGVTANSTLILDAGGDITTGDNNVTVKLGSFQATSTDGSITLGDSTDTTNPALDVANGTATIVAKGDIKGNGNIKVKDSDLTIKSDEGKVTFGEVTDTTNPALSVVNGSAYVVAKNALTVNGDVLLDSLTNNSLINGSSISMGSLTSTNNADRNIAVGALSDKLSILGDVTVSDTKMLQISGANGIDIKATGTKKGDVTVTDSKFAAIADTGNINIDGNLSVDNSIASIVVRDSGTGDITIGNNSAITPALSVTDGSVFISSEGVTTIKGDVLMNNLADLAYISGNSVDIKGDVSIKNSEYASTIYAQDGNLTLGALDVVNNIDPNGKNAKTTIASNGGDIIAKGKLNVEDADIWVSANGAMKIASDTDGTGVAVKVKGGKAEIFAQDDLDINGDIEITEMTDKSSIRGGSVSTGKINIHDNEKAMEIVSTVGNISTKDISVKDNNGELTNIQAKGGITTNNGNVDVANSNLQLIAQDGDVNLGTGTITVDNSTTIISATNGGITSGNIKVSDTAAGNIPTELGMAAKDGSIKTGNIDLSDNVVLKQITSKTVGSTAATDITNGNIKIADNAKYQANSAGNYTAGNITANVAAGSESLVTISAIGNISIEDVIAANLSDLYIRSKEGDIMAGDIDLTNIAVKTIDSDTHASVILAENGAITVKDITLTDMATNPTYIQAKNDLSSGSISLKKADANIISTDGNVTASGNVKADTSNIIMSAGGALTFGDASDLTNPALKVNDGSATILAKNDITAKGNIDVSKADLIIHSKEGGVTLGEETDLTNPALKVANGSAKISADEGALIIKGDVDMTAITADALMQGKSVAMENLKLYDNTKDSIINATEGDVSIKSITLTNNKETVDGKTTNKTITINATDGSINVDKDIIVSSSNLNMLADNGIKGNNLTVSDSVSGDSSNPTFGTILNAENGDVALNKVSVNNAMAAIQSSAGNVNIKDSLTVTTDSETASQAYVIAENGKVSIGEGVTSSTSGVDTGIISAGENSNVTVVGNDVKLGNATTKTAINAGINSTVQIQSVNNVDAANTKVVAMGSTVGIYGAEGNVSIDGITSQMSKVAVNAGKKLNVKGSVNSTGSLLSLIGLEETHIGGSVNATDSSSTIGSNGDVTFDKNVTFKNTVLTSGNSNVDLQVGSISTALTASGTSNTSDEITVANNDTPNLDVNKLIGTIQGKVKDIEEYNSTIEGKNVTVKGSLNATNDLLAIGRGHAVEKLAVNGDTTLDNSVVMINSSGDVVTNGLKAKDAFVFINAKDIKAKDIDTSVSDSSKFISYLETANEKFAVDNNMTMKNTILNSKYTTNIAVGGAGDFNTTVLNIPNANAQFGSLKTENTMVNLQNNQANNTISVTGDYTVAGDNLFYMDFDPATGAYDRVHVGGAIAGADGATITVNSHLVSKGDVANGYQVYDVFHGDKGVNGVTFGLQGETSYSTALANYQMQSLGSGKYAFKRTGYTPTALATPVAVQVGGFLTQVQTYDTAFDNLDMVMMLPMTAYAPNRYAVEDEEAMVYSPLFIPELEKGVWFRPFANFENVDMHQVGGRITSQTYGALAGGDTALKDLGNGYQGMMSAYVGYTGSHQNLDGVSNYQNGGVVGVTGAIYKNGFFSGLTVSANASGNSASTPYGDNDFFMLTAGAASKTGYNWELANGRFIIQPSWLMSYTFANAFNPSDIAGMKFDSSALHAVQLAPGLKFIGNFQNGWQPYLTVDYRFNICDKADYKVGVVDLPDAQVKSYIEYGLGMQKRWGDRFTGYGQFLGRGIGRNGVGLNLGMRWMVGDGRNPR